MQLTREIKREYARKRALAIAECDERTSAAYAALPRLREIAEDRRDTAFELGIALRTAQDRQETMDKAHQHIARLDMEQTEILKKYGVGADYLLPRWSCAACEDTGFVGAVHRRMCMCLKQRLLRTNYATGDIQPSDNFSAFRTDIYKDERQRRLTTRAKEICEQYADAFPNNERHSLLLIGKTGLGKTFLLNCVADRIIANGHSVLKLTSYNMVDAYRSSIFAGAKEIECIMPELLIIDDLGSEPVIPNITIEYLFSVINERQNAGLATAIATNLAPTDILDRYGERLFSRLIAPRLCTVIQLEGADMRVAIN
ncbi:MAG: ATP-binding protein [Clostridia bacterium]